MSVSREFNFSKAAALLPGLLLSDRTVRKRPRLICTGGATGIEQSFSGTSYYMYLAGERRGIIDGVFTLYDGGQDLRLQLRGGFWKLQQSVKGRTSGGFKFAPEFSDMLWKRYLHAVQGADILCNSQLVGDYFVNNRRRYGIGLSFYIDGTLREYIDGYGPYDLALVDHRVFEEAFAVERRGYQDADRIVVMSEDTRSSLVTDYGVDSGKLSVVPPGANLPEDAICKRLPRVPEQGFVLGFVGLYPERKGLPKLIDAVRLLREQGLQAKIRVIGRLPDGMRDCEEFIESMGIIDKRTETEKFLSALSGIDLGCQLSYAELAGIALCEFLRFGIPVVGTRVGGSKDILSKGGSIGVEKEVQPEQLASILSELIADRTRYEELAREAAGLREWAMWGRAVDAIDQALNA